MASEGSKTYWVLAMVDPLTKSGKNGEIIQLGPKACDRPPLRLTCGGQFADKDAKEVVPRWSHNPEEVLVNEEEYELKRVPLTSISLVTTRIIKVNRRSVTNESPTECSHGFHA